MHACVGDGMNIKRNKMTVPRHGGEENLYIYIYIFRLRHLGASRLNITLSWASEELGVGGRRQTTRRTRG